LEVKSDTLAPKRFFQPGRLKAQGWKTSAKFNGPHLSLPPGLEGGEILLNIFAAFGLLVNQIAL